MKWFSDLLLEHSFIQAILVLSLICAAGLACNKLKFKGVSLGVTFVFFAGILAGHLGISIDPQMLLLAQNFGLILFVYSLGLQVGPSFFPSLKKGGMKLNLLAFAVIGAGLLTMFAFVWLGNMPLHLSMGLFSGAVTNTPMLGAAQQSLLQADPSALAESNGMAVACAVGYPFGVIGVILCVIVLKVLFGRRRGNVDQHDSQTFVTEFRVSNPSIFGKTIREIMNAVPVRLVVSRVWKFSLGADENDGRQGKVIIPDGETLLEEGEHVLVLSKEKDVDAVEMIFGHKVNKDWNSRNIDWNSIDGVLVSRHVLVTRPDRNGVKLGDLHLRNLYGVNITRVNRAGIDILPSSGLHLQLGDKLTVVGRENAIDRMAEVLGNQEKELRTPNLFSLFIGIVLGLLLGSIPIMIPGMSSPIKLGIAGGPIIIGILMGAFGPRIHLTTYTTHSASLMLRQLGITVYLAGLGLSAGPDFFSTVFRPEGLLWIGASLVMAILPVLLVGYIASRFLGTDYSSNVGMLCGSMANPIALEYALSTVDDDKPSVAYATVYPVCMFLRVISAQIIMLI